MMLPGQIICMILSHLELPELLKCRVVNKTMETYCRRQLETEYVNKSYAFIGAYTCGYRIKRGRWFSDTWKPKFESEYDMISWRGLVLTTDLPIDGLFVWICIPDMKRRLVFADLPRKCIKCRLQKDFSVATYVHSGYVMDDVQINTLDCILPRRVIRHFNGPWPEETLRENLEWQDPPYRKYLGTNVDGRFCQILFLNDSDLWELGM